MLKAAGLRRPGAAALDLAYVAAGRVDGFWEMGLKPWDTAAGTLLITEAGGRVGTLIGEEYKQGGHIVARHAKVFAALVAALAPHAPARFAEARTLAAAPGLTNGFSARRPCCASGSPRSRTRSRRAIGRDHEPEEPPADARVRRRSRRARSTRRRRYAGMHRVHPHLEVARQIGALGGAARSPRNTPGRRPPACRPRSGRRAG